MLAPHLLSVEPGGKLAGRLRVPGDKSISHRALMLGAIAEGVTDVRGFLAGEDTLATLRAFESMGVRVERLGADGIRIHGAGLHGLRPAPGPIDLGNSGTSMRLMTGLLAGQAFDTELTGDESLSRRPMMRVIDPLRRMGARIECSAAGTPPVRIFAGARLRGIDYDMPVASAQVKSGILLAGLYAQGRTCVREGFASRDHSERMLGRFGCPIQRQDGAVCMRGVARLASVDVDVPADLSSASFFIVGATIACGSDLLLEGVGVNPTRTGVIEILRRMGADIELQHKREEGGEPVADLRVRASELCGTRIPGELVPAAIDEFPALFIAAACARGETLLEGAEELRYKESDRIAVMAEGLQRLGIEARPTPDGMRIRGAAIQGGCVESGGDHRVAMAFAIAGLRAERRIVIADCAAVATSFPNFLTLAREAGLRITAGIEP
ncbi:MAG: 3-phosphoshikimate 1-carboxyvinyltransferase [Gammaproteobacteria bacterium]